MTSEKQKSNESDTKIEWKCKCGNKAMFSTSLLGRMVQCHKCGATSILGEVKGNDKKKTLLSESRIWKKIAIIALGIAIFMFLLLLFSRDNEESAAYETQIATLKTTHIGEIESVKKKLSNVNKQLAELIPKLREAENEATNAREAAVSANLNLEKKTKELESALLLEKLYRGRITDLEATLRSKQIELQSMTELFTECYLNPPPVIIYRNYVIHVYNPGQKSVAVKVTLNPKGSNGGYHYYVNQLSGNCCLIVGRAHFRSNGGDAFDSKKSVVDIEAVFKKSDKTEWVQVNNIVLFSDKSIPDTSLPSTTTNPSSKPPYVPSKNDFIVKKLRWKKIKERPFGQTIYYSLAATGEVECNHRRWVFPYIMVKVEFMDRSGIVLFEKTKMIMEKACYGSKHTFSVTVPYYSSQDKIRNVSKVRAKAYYSGK